MTDLEKIYVEYFEPVYKFLISLGCDNHSAEEITQETMVIAIQKIDSFKGNCKLSVWLCQIAKNLYFKKRKEDKKLVSDEALDSIAVLEKESDPELKKKILFRNILVAIFTVLILGVACTGVIHYLKRTTVPIPETKHMEVVYENDDLVLNITDAIWSDASGVRFTLTEDGKSYECVAVAMNTSKWNELISSDKTCSKYVIAYRDKGANEIDRVYYSGYGKDLEYPHNGELNENDIQTLDYTLVWSR